MKDLLMILEKAAGDLKVPTKSLEFHLHSNRRKLNTKNLKRTLLFDHLLHIYQVIRPVSQKIKDVKKREALIAAYEDKTR